MKQILFAGSLLLLAFVYLSWRDNGDAANHGAANRDAANRDAANRDAANRDAANENPANYGDAAIRADKDTRLEILGNVFGSRAGDPSTGNTSSTNTRAHSPTGTGQMIPREEYQPCIDSFAAVMGRYGITSDNPPVPIKSMPAMTYPITTSESLQGSGLLDFITAVVMKYDPDGKGANLDFQLQSGICTPKFVTDYGQPAALAGRISIFVVPAYRTTNAASAVKTKMKAATGGDPGVNGYELGGVQPSPIVRQRHAMSVSGAACRRSHQPFTRNVSSPKRSAPHRRSDRASSPAHTNRPAYDSRVVSIL
jgi:hypothetical protein